MNGSDPAQTINDLLESSTFRLEYDLNQTHLIWKRSPKNRKKTIQLNCGWLKKYSNISAAAVNPYSSITAAKYSQ